MAGKSKKSVDISTEEKIKEAARTVFTQKGFAAARTRDIAAASGINLALLNYYFRSKEKLFGIVMAEKLQQFFGVIAPELNNPHSTLRDKTERIAAAYIDMITANPDLPLFVLSELRSSPAHFLKIADRARVLTKSVFVRQIRKAKPGLHPLHFVMNLLGICVFPFIMFPVLQQMDALDEKTFAKMMRERKALVPVWIDAMLGAD